MLFCLVKDTSAVRPEYVLAVLWCYVRAADAGGKFPSIQVDVAAGVVFGQSGPKFGQGLPTREPKLPNPTSPK